MKRLVLFVAALGVYASAHAAEDVEFKHSGDFRFRYFNNMDRTGEKTPSDDQTYTDHRFRLNLGVRKGEHQKAGLTLIHGATWGDKAAFTTTGGAHQGDGTKDQNVAANQIMVNKAWGWWKASDSMSFTFGRQGLKLGNGAVFGENDSWQIPTSHDGAKGTWESDFGNLNLFILKTNDTYPNSFANGNSDSERNIWGLAFDLKGIDALKVGTFHLAVLRQDEGAGTAGSVMKNINNIGFALGGDMNNIMYRADLNIQNGKTKTGAASDTNVNAMMYDLMVGYMMPETMNFKVWLGYHNDTGDKASTDSDNQAYDSLYYDRDVYNAPMHFLYWGNLTYFHLGLSMTAMEGLDVGTSYYMFSKEQAAAASSGTNFGEDFSATPSTITTKADAKELGSEWDIWARKTYEGGFNFGARVGMFMPASALKDATVKKEATVTQLLIDGGMTF